MDITAAAFLEGQPMLQLIGSTVGMQNVSGGLNPGQVRSINKAIRGVQVQPCKTLGRHILEAGLGLSLPCSSSFDLVLDVRKARNTLEASHLHG